MFMRTSQTVSAEISRPGTAHALANRGLTHQTFGVAAAFVGWALVTAALVLSAGAGFIAVTGGPGDRLAALEALTFGLAIAGLGTAKTGIGVVLWSILHRIWNRITSLKAALPDLLPPAPEGRHNGSYGVTRTFFGPVSVTAEAPRPLFIHRIARAMWAPMLVMGAMFLYLGLFIAVVQSQQVAANPGLAQSLKAWVQGTQFLGEGFLLSAISFLLGTILGAIRAGGGEVQQSLRVSVRTLLMPWTAKVFVGLMIAGLMIEVVQFFLYAYVASLTDAAMIAAWSAWLGPFREFGLGVLLSGIVLALATIAKALDFQFSRIRELITTGR
jgi:hypothetical protein